MLTKLIKKKRYYEKGFFYAEGIIKNCIYMILGSNTMVLMNIILKNIKKKIHYDRSI